MILFGEASMENVRAIKVMLRSFELVSGIKINFAKEGVRNAVSYLNYSLLIVPFSYLGVPTEANP